MTDELHNKIDILDDKLDELKKDVGEMKVSLGILMEKSKKIDMNEYQIGTLQGRMNTAEGKIAANSVSIGQYLNSKLGNTFNYLIQVFILVIGGFLIFQLNKLNANINVPNYVNIPLNVQRTN